MSHANSTVPNRTFSPLIRSCSGRSSGMSKLFRSSIWALATSIAAGCTSLSGSTDPLTEPAPEPDYKKIVAAAAAGNLKDPASFGPLQISAIKRSAATQYGDWAVCVKGMQNDRPIYFGVAIREHKIVSWGQAVIVDRCATEQYEPMAPPEEAAKLKKAAPPKRGV
jgi:hypothetical protein